MLSADHEVRLFDGSLVAVSGHRGLALLTPTEIVVKVRRGRVRIYGESLRLVEASSTELYVSGKIVGVEYPL